ncbi:MAG: aminoacyl-tRNA hydrolase, partial [Planctomycetota bacterium]
MKLLVGLGNPGPRYAATRHNVGVRIVERWAVRRGVALDEERFDGRYGQAWVGTGEAAFEVGVLLPLTYMNHSGSSVSQAVAGVDVGDSASDLVVVFDEVDLPFGRLRVRPSGSSG